MRIRTKYIHLQQENIKNALSQITSKILLFQENAEFPEIRRIEKNFMACKFRLIICLSFHKKFGLKTICFAWEKIEVFWRIFFIDFCGHLETNLFLLWSTIYYRLFSMKQSFNILKHNSNPKSHISWWEKLYKKFNEKSGHVVPNYPPVPNYPLLR